MAILRGPRSGLSVLEYSILGDIIHDLGLEVKEKVAGRERRGYSVERIVAEKERGGQKVKKWRAFCLENGLVFLNLSTKKEIWPDTFNSPWNNDRVHR